MSCLDASSSPIRHFLPLLHRLRPRRGRSRQSAISRGACQPPGRLLPAHFVRGKGLFVETEYVPTDEKANRRFPLLLTTGRILSQYNVGAQTRRTENNIWHTEDLLEIHPSDAETRGIREGDLVSLASRKGDLTLKATISERIQPGVVYTTFHNPETGANVVTTEYSDWATSCPEYKVTAVEVRPATHRSEWQREFLERASQQGRILGSD